ncbi:MAG: sn-glycerol-3-phosphate ABC transporter ATP-binding protein UgpC, partial [Clostridia bacterium]|nr:sn-glycerol-3-phosphate ABC transporter ATP-binding protein UgpC [Clostridia bacterium]
TTPSVTDFTLDIEDKEFIVFVGPSGCGKSTTLRRIAGLEEITEGELYIDGNLVNEVQPKDRDIAMVFQNYALYPHMTVYDNMAFGLKLRKMPKAQIDERVKEAARILGLEQYLTRKPKALSGGQRQRVALGRAIVREPKVFLLDEPLSNLDAKLRAQMRTEITKLHHRLATTFIYVTHDQVEAMTMGTRIVVMKDGYIQQVDAPQNLYDYPANLFVAGFIGTPQMNFFDAVITGTENEVYIEFEGNKIKVPKGKVAKIINLKDYLNTGKPVVFGVRPEDFHDEAAYIANSRDTVINVKVDVVEKLGAETLLYCVFDKKEEENPDEIKSLVDGATQLVAKVDSRSTTDRDQKVEIAIDIMHTHLFDKETEFTLLEGEGQKAYVPEVENARKKARDAADAKKAADAEVKAAQKALDLAKKEAVKHPSDEANKAVEAAEAHLNEAKAAADAAAEKATSVAEEAKAEEEAVKNKQ